MAHGAGLVLVVIAGCGRIDFTPLALIDADARPLCERVTGVIYCNDFEGGALPGVRMSAGMYTFVPGGGYLGTDGYRLDAPVPGDRPEFQIDLPTPITFGELHIGGRMLVAPGAPVAGYAVIAEADYVGAGKVSFDLQGMDRANVVNTVATPTGQVLAAVGSFPRGRWACFDFVVFADADGGAGYAAVSIDDVPTVEGFDHMLTMPVGGWTQATIGLITGSANTESMTATFDNWIVSTSPIGCP